MSRAGKGGRGRPGQSARRISVARIFTWPLLIAAVSTVGLISALTGDGVRDALSWAALAVPVIVVGWAMRMRRS